MSRAFLTAEWRNLVILNYVVDPAMLVPEVVMRRRSQEFRARRVDR
ncbi:MAG: hypothetical protein ABJC63_15205 [Gemmatimonadales bacterium]